MSIANFIKYNNDTTSKKITHVLLINQNSMGNRKLFLSFKLKIIQDCYNFD